MAPKPTSIWGTMSALSTSTSRSQQRDHRAGLRRGHRQGAARRLSSDGTIQVIPHITNEIKCRISHVARDGVDVVIVEIGGTVGDIESLPFLEAIRQMRKDVGRENTVYIHLTLLPYIAATGELKTKPTQHSVHELRGIGIQPDVIVCRSDYPVDDDIKTRSRSSATWTKRRSSPWSPRQHLQSAAHAGRGRLGDLVAKRLGLTARDARPDLAKWRELVAQISTPKATVKHRPGRQVRPASRRLHERQRGALSTRALANDVTVDWITTEDLEKRAQPGDAGQVHGIVVPGGFGYRGIEGKIVAGRYARETRSPTWACAWACR